MTNWKRIGRFPPYEVSDAGEVRNGLTGKVLKTKVNQHGIVAVGLMKEGLQFHRSVSVLVAQAFVDRKPNHDTTINLDGNLNNNAADNLLWRPRWHAVEYKRQFEQPWPTPITKPIQDLEGGPIYDNSWDCCTSLGFLEKDLVLSILNRTYVFPTFQEFKVL